MVAVWERLDLHYICKLTDIIVGNEYGKNVYRAFSAGSFSVLQGHQVRKSLQSNLPHPAITFLKYKILLVKSLWSATTFSVINFILCLIFHKLSLRMIRPQYGRGCSSDMAKFATDVLKSRCIIMCVL